MIRCFLLDYKKKPFQAILGYFTSIYTEGCGKSGFVFPKV